MGELDIRLLLRQLREEPDPDPMAERLMEMYREWCREGGITTSREPESETRLGAGSSKTRRGVR